MTRSTTFWAFLLVVLAAVPARAESSAPAAVASAAVPSEPAPVAPPAVDLKTLPMGTGLPLMVRVAMFFVDVAAIDDNGGTFTATVDLRIRWQDSRLAYPKSETTSGFQEHRAAAADAKLEEIWWPEVRLANVEDEAPRDTRALRIDPSGRVELMQRTAAHFKMSFDVEKFPFDRQMLGVEVLSERFPANLVAFDYHQDDLDFSRVARGVTVPGWTLGLVDLRRDPQPGWHGETHAQVWAALQASRQPGSVVAPIFIPLFASLLIPLLALWLNGIVDGDFKIEAFELANVLIGGLFAVIALNFTVNSSYTVLAGDNPVSSLFGLNYALLAMSIGINILLFRFNLAKRAFGRYVQQEVYAYLVWALPVLVLVSAAAVVLTAMA